MDVIGLISLDYADYDYPDVAGLILGYGVGSPHPIITTTAIS